MNTKLEKFKSDLLTESHARNVLFEKEIQFYEKLFESVLELRDACAQITAFWVTVDHDEPRVDREQKRLTALSKAHDKVLGDTMSHRPFYPEDVFTDLDEMLKITEKGISVYRTIIQDMTQAGSESADARYWRSLKEDCEKVLNLTELIVKKIRGKLETRTAAAKRR